MIAVKAVKENVGILTAAILQKLRHSLHLVKPPRLKHLCCHVYYIVP
jgi:hypothetical protein